MPGKHMPHWTASCCFQGAAASATDRPSGASASDRPDLAVRSECRPASGTMQSACRPAEPCRRRRSLRGRRVWRRSGRTLAKNVDERRQGIAGRYLIFAVDLQSQRHRILVRNLSFTTVRATRSRLCARDWEELSRDTIPAPRHCREARKLRNGAPLFRRHAPDPGGGRSIRPPIRASAVPPPRPIRRRRRRS